MKKYVVSLLALLFFLLPQTPHALAGGPVRGGIPPRGFVVVPGHRHFVSPSIIIINPAPSGFVRLSPFAREIFILPNRLVGNTVIIEEPFFCFGHGAGFINEASFFDHLHQFHGLAFETIPTVVVRSGSRVFFFGN